MISMESSVYSQTELSQKKPVSAVPTVLRVGPTGEIEEVTDPRQKVNMTNLIKMTPVSATPSEQAPPLEPNRVMTQKKNIKAAAPSQMLQQALSVPKESNPIVPLTAASPSEMPPLTASSNLFKTVTPMPEAKRLTATQIPGTTIMANPLLPIPATPVASSQPMSEPLQPLQPMQSMQPMKPMPEPIQQQQQPLIEQPVKLTHQGIPPIGQIPEKPMSPILQKGGGPWSAFLQVASQAAPAAALLGAYAMLPTKRSSGLPAARRTRRKEKAKAN